MSGAVPEGREKGPRPNLVKIRIRENGQIQVDHLITEKFRARLEIDQVSAKDILSHHQMHLFLLQDLDADITTRSHRKWAVKHLLEEYDLDKDVVSIGSWSSPGVGVKNHTSVV